MRSNPVVTFVSSAWTFLSRACAGLLNHLSRLEEEGQGDRQVEDLGGPLTPHRLCLTSQHYGKTVRCRALNRQSISRKTDF